MRFIATWAFEEVRFLHQLEQVISKIVRPAFLPRPDIFLGAEGGQRLSIDREGAGGNVALHFEETQELLGERVPGVARGHESYSGFSILVRPVAARARSLYWLRKIGAGFVEMSSYFFRTNSG